ncbi:MAG TPA: phosphatase PAP2 family protein [Pyrinomonadaceae bacterium]|jgi:membrane-associated phospholipid phosphatase|nr:phosphatase PAP2 family protein [Pyrinomonadaceae bacterium]
MKNEPTTSHQIAKVISVIGHPFVLLALTILVAAASRESPARAAGIGAIAILATIFPMLFIIRQKVKAGKWSDHDVSDAAERRNFYPLMMAVLGFSLVVFYLLGFPRPLLVGMIISLAILFVAMVINRWSKISLHLTFAVYFAVSLLAVNYWMSGGLLALAIAVGWSRIKLERHNPAQVLSGALLGAIAGIFLLKANGFF